MAVGVTEIRVTFHLCVNGHDGGWHRIAGALWGGALRVVMMF